MRFYILLFILATSGFSSDTVKFFQESPENRLLCHLGTHSFKMISQKNSVIEEIHGHMFFKLKDENLYFMNNACQMLIKQQ